MDGITHSDPKSQSEILNDQFVSVFTKEDMSSIPSKGTSPYPDLPHITITGNGVNKRLWHLNPQKASGPDSIQTRILKVIAHQISPALTILFQTPINQGTRPADWKSAFIVPLFKKGNRSQASNYHPISLIYIVCKSLEHIIHTNIISHMDWLGILHDAQHGFRKCHSSESELLLSINDLGKGVDDGQQIDAILLDFSKAFDKEPHMCLLEKLCYYGVMGPELKWMKVSLVTKYNRL